MLKFMKATIDIPDDLYRKVKAKSALESRPAREVAIELSRNWIGESPAHAADQSRSLHERLQD